MFHLILSALFSFQDDSELIDRLKRHEPLAMADLYDRFGKVAFSVILHIVKDEDFAEELLRETFITIWNRVGGFNRSGSGSLGLWVLAIARNRAIDYLRAAGPKSSQGGGNIAALDEPRFFAPLDPDFHNTDRIRTLCDAFIRLDDNQRQVLELAYSEGLSLNEMSVKLRQPPGAVKTWARTALKLLRGEPGQVMGIEREIE